LHATRHNSPTAHLTVCIRLHGQALRDFRYTDGAASYFLDDRRHNSDQVAPPGVSSKVELIRTSA